MLFFDDINWDRVNRAQAKALAEKEFKRANKEIPNLLLQSEIFNFIPLSYEGDCGYTCYLGLKKYPNVYAVFEYTPTNITNDVVFQYYIDENHFMNYCIPLHCFFALIHFNDNDAYFSEEYFYGHIKKIVGDIEADRFYISEDISFDKNNAERFLNYHSYVLYEITDDSLEIDAESEPPFVCNVKTTYFEPNELQHKLILLWLSDKDDKKRYAKKKIR